MGTPSRDGRNSFDMAVRYYETVHKRINTRIDQMWRARYTTWGVLIAVGAFFIGPDGMNGNCGLAEKILIPALCFGLALFHMGLERIHEHAIRQHERPRAAAWIDFAEQILVGEMERDGLPAPKFDKPLLTPIGRVATLRLWSVSFILAFAISMLLWCGGKGKDKKDDVSAAPKSQAPAKP